MSLQPSPVFELSFSSNRLSLPLGIHGHQNTAVQTSSSSLVVLPLPPAVTEYLLFKQWTSRIEVISSMVAIPQDIVLQRPENSN
jgi:hypothetical protein